MASRSQLERKEQLSQDSDDDDDKKDDNDFPFTSQWDSRMFVIERDGDGTLEGVQLSEYFDANISKKTRKLVYPLYIIIALAS
eukprot:CAMPEP_0201568244 /NCGR_PEP_ID=MMETSP0190_2-20130828/9207_1 /ASSEMBLY_ACC=CAM_ASM_000263 /TAXON_ID=37353 /ORGANISM="Rosalina sp." /LENGTH=82 /DNA_ID=CAMNT_0047989137 /DNA_START=30 /DNA_END=274 /DNA_ORIENTATION=+